MAAFEGGRLCGAVRYRVTAAPLAGVACHCRDCQYLSGGAEANVVVVSRKGFWLTKGEERVHRCRADSGAEAWRSFCPICGMPLFAGNEPFPDKLAIRVGTLDDPSWFKRQGHIWVGSAPPWHLIEPDLPRSDKNPDFM